MSKKRMPTIKAFRFFDFFLNKFLAFISSSCFLSAIISSSASISFVSDIGFSPSFSNSFSISALTASIFSLLAFSFFKSSNWFSKTSMYFLLLWINFLFSGLASNFLISSLISIISSLLGLWSSALAREIEKVTKIKIKYLKNFYRFHILEHSFDEIKKTENSWQIENKFILAW